MPRLSVFVVKFDENPVPLIFTDVLALYGALLKPLTELITLVTVGAGAV